MPLYKYTAKDLDSKKISGKLEAASEKELASFLFSKEQYLIRCRDVTEEETQNYKMKLKELSDFSRQIGTMLGSGVSLIRAVSILVQRERKPKLKQIYTNLYRMLQQGKTLSMAMSEQKAAFPELMINMYRSGESSGQMEKVAMTMAVQYEKDYRIQTKLRNAMIYPIILGITTILVIIAVFVKIIPQFTQLFNGMQLPLVTVIIQGLSDFMVHYWYWILIVVLCVIAAVSSILRTERVRYAVDKKKLTLWKIGELMQTIYTARFARTLCSLYSSGVTILHALTIVRSTIGNTYIASQFDQVISIVKNGGALSQAIQSMDGFDSKLASSIFVGEESGKLDAMLTSLADEFDYEAEMATQRMISFMEPAMIVVLALFVLLVMLAVLLPIYQMYQNPTGLK